MANLFNTFLRLTQLKDNNGFSDNQRDFIAKIIDGTSQWSPLIELANTTKIDELNSLKSSLEAEIANTSYFSFQTPHWNYQYLSSLNSVLSDVHGVLKLREHLQTYSKKDAEKYNKFANRIDTIYKQTVQTYHGTIMCPVNQGLDPRLGNSVGECFGYAAHWAAQILKNERPFGIGLNQQQTMQPIPFNSLLARKYPEINHFAALTKEISIYQKLQLTLKKVFFFLRKSPDKYGVQIGDEFIDDNKNLNYVFYSYAKKFPVFYFSTREIAQALINEAQSDPNKVYNLYIKNYLVGHALGFCIINKKYHFFDSNAGWFRFDNDNDFINWFVHYYKQIGYQSYYFNEYIITSYSMSKKIDDKQFEPLPWGVIAFLSPFIVVHILIGLIDNYIIRGFRYLGIAVNEYFNSTDEQPKIEKPDSASHVTLLSSIPKSFEGLDLAVLDKGEKKVVQSTKVLDYLDLAVSDTNLKNLRSQSFFKEPGSIKANTKIVEDAYQGKFVTS